MSLESKIKIAKKQQEIAEIEARKKLAERKEERNIQEGIDQIKNELESTLLQIKTEHQNNVQLTEKLTETAKHHAEAQSQLSVEKDARAKVENELLSVKDTVKSLSEKVISFNNETNKVKAEMSSLIRENDDLKKQLPELQSYNKHLINELNFISKKAPEFIRLIHKDGMMELEFNSTNYSRVLNTLTSIANNEFNTNGQKTLMSLSGFDITAPYNTEKMNKSESNELTNGHEKKEIIMGRKNFKKKNNGV
jgi:chromosome segregation ATPase